MKRLLQALSLLAMGLAGCEDSATPLPPPPVSSCANYAHFTHWVGALNELQFSISPTIDGHFLYTATGNNLRIIEISNPRRPTPAGQYDIGSRVRKVVVRSGLAYVLTTYSAVVVDVEEPSNPVALGSVLFVSGAIDFDVRGDGFLYVVTGTGLQVVDARNPNHPALAGNLTLASIRGVVVVGSYAYVSTFSELIVVDVADPRAPWVASRIQFNMFVGRLVASEGRLYISTYETISVFDLDHPASPRLLGQAETQDPIYGLEVQGNRIFAVVGQSFDNAVEVFQVPSSGRPYVWARFGTPGDITPAGVAVSGDYAFVADTRTGLQVFDVAAAGSLENSIGFDVGDRVQDVVAVGNHLFVAAWRRGLVLVDVSDPDRPVIVGEADTPDVAEGVAVSGDLAYVADWDSGLHIIDISNRAAPRTLGSVDTPGYAKHVAVDGNHAYVADNTGGLQVVDVTNPAAPRLIKTIATGLTIDVAVQDGFVYTAGFGAMHVIDVADPAAAHSVGSASVGAAWGIAVRGTRVFVAGNGLDIFDVSTPSAPVLLSRMAMPTEVRGVDVVGDVAYLADFHLGVVGVDVSNPTNPTVLGTVSIPNLSHRVVQHAGRLFVASLDRGIVVAPTHCP